MNIKQLFLVTVLTLPWSVSAQEAKNLSASSPENRVAVLELYTSEGCSSCPPADHFLSALKESGISEKQLIPMAFHVTYWDYIGWRDRYGNKEYDQRQRDLAKINNQRTIYTPQFVLVGDDYRRYTHFRQDLNKLVAEKSELDLQLTVHSDENSSGSKLTLELTANPRESGLKRLNFYFVVTENNLSSDVDDGENEGRKLTHDYVVRHLSRAYQQHGVTSASAKTSHSLSLSADWKQQDLSIVAFAQDRHTGEVLQAVSVKF